MSRSMAACAALLAGALGVAGAGCNLIVGVGDYATGSADGGGAETATGDDGAPTGSDGGTDAGNDGNGTADAPTDALSDGPTTTTRGDTGRGQCSPDGTVACGKVASGYACTGADRPDTENSTLVCYPLDDFTGGVPGDLDAGASGPGSFCCITPTCGDDDTVLGCASGFSGYSCSGSDTPQEDFGGLACQPVASTGSATSGYCCTSSTCEPDTTVTGCAPGSTGYSCGGFDLPQQTFTTLACTGSGADGGGSASGEYCCAPSTCAVDVVDASALCPSGRTGYSCAGADTPTQAFTTATSCTGSEGAGYCCTGAPTCAFNGDCLTESAAVNVVCQRSSLTCQAATGAVGDPCAMNTDCSSGTTCNGKWCVPASCTNDASCGSNSAGLRNECQPLSGGTSGCFPGCAQNADCEVYSGDGADTFCIPEAGQTGGACSGNSGMIGDPCLGDDDCNVGSCGDTNSCTQSCASSSDTSCGMNSLQETNLCVNDPLGGGFECMPPCLTDHGCLAFGGGKGSCVVVTNGSACEP
jgi:hypothetical protein